MTRPVLTFLVTQQPDMETDPDGNPALTVKRADGEDITLQRGQRGQPLKNYYRTIAMVFPVFFIRE
jgi:hypothetical protein